MENISIEVLPIPSGILSLSSQKGRCRKTRLQDYGIQEYRLISPPSTKCDVLRESLSEDSQNIPCTTLKRRGRSNLYTVYFCQHPLHLVYTLRVGLLIYLYLCWLSGWNPYISTLSAAHKHAAAPPPYHHSVHLITLGIISVSWVAPRLFLQIISLCSRTSTLSVCSDIIQRTGHKVSPV